MAPAFSAAFRRSRSSRLAGLFLTSAALLLPLASAADPQTEARYPYDPACPWGRLSNGKGMLHRCISEAEAQKLVTEAKAPALGTPPTPPTAEPAVEAPSATAAAPVTVKLGAIVADKGELTIGKLGKPMDRYAACIDDNGGLTAKQGSVTIQFLVRAEFGRAEGVEVQKFSGVSKKAARCLADVVDRRQVGAPTVPLTGATLSFEIAPSK